ncbi:SLAM family member 5-like isoform X2 [Puntigrus tetrazona]|uniref:SLAM family member 5-like isoform X2 n=1 Tax=Puntigrus tetrazona TaxID=1606681 RepID=UPI001C8942A0|nr:SLAM family member 5-like isoform X2 [Puntigrus tetrazona]
MRALIFVLFAESLLSSSCIINRAFVPIYNFNSNALFNSTKIQQQRTGLSWRMRVWGRDPVTALQQRSGMFVADTNEIQSVMEGDSVSLNSDLTQIHNETIAWTFESEKANIAKIRGKKQNFSTFDNVLDGRFRDRLKLDHQTGSLTIMNTRTTDSGLYKLQILTANLYTKMFNVTVYARLPVPVINRDCSSSSSSSCSLLCSVVNVGHVTLSWYKGNSLLSSISVSDLSISLSLPLEVEHQDKNTYSCVINNPIRNQTTHLNISQLCHTCSGSLVAVISVVVGALLIVAAVGIFCFFKKCRKTDKKDQTCKEEITYAETTFNKREIHKRNFKEENHVVYASVATRQQKETGSWGKTYV